MKIKWSPIVGAKSQSFQLFVGDSFNNYGNINGFNFAFPTSIIMFTNTVSQTGNVIIEAHRENGELFLTAVRFYNGGNSPDWDTGQYQNYQSNILFQGVVDVVMTGKTQAQVDAENAQAVIDLTNANKLAKISSIFFNMILDSMTASTSATTFYQELYIRLKAKYDAL